MSAPTAAATAVVASTNEVGKRWRHRPEAADTVYVVAYSGSTFAILPPHPASPPRKPMSGRRGQRRRCRARASTAAAGPSGWVKENGPAAATAAVLGGSASG